MRFKRNESFRYEFEHPIDATFKIIEINGVAKVSKPAQAKIKNISPKGIKLLSNLDVQLSRINSIKVEIHILLNTDPIVVKGSFIRQQKEIEGYSYGIEIESSEANDNVIIEELKKFSKGTVYVKETNE